MILHVFELKLFHCTGLQRALQVNAILDGDSDQVGEVASAET